MLRAKEGRTFMEKEATTEVKKKSVSDIIIDKILRDVDDKGCMPWQRPYEMYNSFNYFTLHTYKGINRLLLPFGEYITQKQINEYNRTHNEDYRFAKGIKWYPVVFFKTDVKKVSKETVDTLLEQKKEDLKSINIKSKGRKYLFNYMGWSYYIEDGEYYKEHNILRYTPVADRTFFINSKGETLPSRIECGEVEITMSKPDEVLQNYLDRSGIIVEETVDIPCYSPSLDLIKLNKHFKDEGCYFSTSFHECAHSTGHPSRLNRDSLIKSDKNSYAVDECIAEITASLLCAETGIHNFETSGTLAYQTNLAYINSWKKRIKNFGKEFIYIVSQADKAFNYIMSFTDDSWEEGTL